MPDEPGGFKCVVSARVAGQEALDWQRLLTRCPCSGLFDVTLKDASWSAGDQTWLVRFESPDADSVRQVLRHLGLKPTHMASDNMLVVGAGNPSR